MNIYEPIISVVLTWGVAEPGLSSIYDKPESQSQEGPHSGQPYKDPQSRAEHHPWVGRGNGGRASQLDHSSQGWLWWEQID